MDREAIFTSLREAEPVLRTHGVQSLAVFGSVARGIYSQDSDLDILVDFSRPVGLFDFIRLKQYLESITQRRVDLVTPDALRPEMKDRILKEAVHVR
jgi:predicted nucleotidyltransferase